jgi:GH15 family glucan-1,4-alpha-glucosidase
LLAAGRADAAAAALRWLERTQAPEGLWLQRYWTTGEPAPSWGLHQVDETGVVLVTAEAAFGELGDEELDRALWPVVRRAAEFLVAFLDPSTGLPKASTDLWEQHDGQHTYSAASVAGGLRCASLAAARHEPELGERFGAAAARVAKAIEEQLWDERLGRYRRAVNVARPDGRGAPPGTEFDRGLPYASRRVGSVDPVDKTLDSSLLGLVWPVPTFGTTSARVRATVDAVADGLTTPAGGLLRHDGDSYAGGHEWPIATLWLALARRALGDDPGHAQGLAHVAGRRTALDLLPEQCFADGTPAWVLPLGWSHAMLLLAARPELRLLQRLRGEMTGDGRGG